MARQTPRERIEAGLVGHFARNGFRLREEVWVRDHGPLQDWVSLEPRESRWEPLSYDAVVGVRVDPVERLLAQILGQRMRRRSPTFVRHLSQLHYEGTNGIRTGGARWVLDANALKQPDRFVADFGNAFDTSAMPFLERLTSLDALAAEMTQGRIDGDVAYRLPVLHLLRADNAAAREVIEQGTRWMATADADIGAYRAFALEVVRRLGDAQIEETPCEELVSVLRPALRVAFPDRAGIILAALVRSFWWEAHPRTGDVEHCAFCGTTEVEARLFGRTRQICDTCVAAGFVFFEDPRAAGATRIERPAETSGPRRGLPGYGRVAANSSAVSAANLAADAVRALRGTVEDADRYVASVERRLLSAPADRDPASVCVACGPIRRGRAVGYEWSCSFCGTYLHDEPSVDGGRVAICEGCVREMYEEVDESRRLI